MRENLFWILWVAVLLCRRTVAGFALMQAGLRLSQLRHIVPTGCTFVYGTTPVFLRGTVFYGCRWHVILRDHTCGCRVALFSTRRTGPSFVAGVSCAALRSGSLRLHLQRSPLVLAHEISHYIMNAVPGYVHALV